MKVQNSLQDWMRDGTSIPETRLSSQVWEWTPLGRGMKKKGLEELKWED